MPKLSPPPVPHFSPRGSARASFSAHGGSSSTQDGSSSHERTHENTGTNYDVPGAAAASGLSLADVAAEAKHESEIFGTMGVALSVCTLPGQPKSDRLGPGRMELGLGIHGVRGAAVANGQPVDLVETYALTSMPLLTDLFSCDSCNGTDDCSRKGCSYIAAGTRTSCGQGVYRVIYDFSRYGRVFIIDHEGRSNCFATFGCTN